MTLSFQATPTVNHGTVPADKQWLVDLAAKEAAERDIAAAMAGDKDAAASVLAQLAVTTGPNPMLQALVSASADDVRAEIAPPAATAPTEPDNYAVLLAIIKRLDQRIEGLEHNTSVLTNAYALKEKEVATLRNSVAGSALKTEGIPEVAVKTGSTAILDAMAAAAGLASRGTVRNAMDGTDGARNRWLVLRRIARERAAVANNGAGRKYNGREPLTTDADMLTWLNTDIAIIGTSPWLFLRELNEDVTVWLQAYRILFTGDVAAGGRGWTDAQLAPYLVAYGQHATDPRDASGNLLG